MWFFSRRAVPRWVSHALGGATGRGVRVALIGSGYDSETRPDPRVLPGMGFADPSDDLELLRTTDDHDRTGYGTAAAHLVWRVAPDAQVIPVRIYGNGTETSPGTLYAALRWVVEQTPDVVCIAAGIAPYLQETLKPLYAAVEAGRRKGMVYVCGGDPDEEWNFMPRIEPVIGVRVGTFATPFDYCFYPDVAYEMMAWGEPGPLGPVYPGKRELRHDYASAVAAGIVALLRQRHPGADVDQIRGLLHRFSR